MDSKKKKEEAALEALAEALAAKVRAQDKTGLTAFKRIEAPPSQPHGFDSITRAFVLRRIRFLVRTYKLEWLVDEIALDSPSLDALSDSKLSYLLSECDRAMECARNGIPFEEADFVRPTASRLPPV